ncbi:hypothetical protein PHMEG_00023446 [Phytophthora megakarya]|uniref:Uncharacterized protein n=1 Tax=Phytophthora megakarya TaxID=4795 RepID=A0A225VID8_9STRA|nr:hypothetical protein PHMEG_00023446 [Phytophthora megakarya]
MIIQKAMIQVRVHTAVRTVEPINLMDILIIDFDDEFIVVNGLHTLPGINIRQPEQLVSRGKDELAFDPMQLEADEMPVQRNGLHVDADIISAVENLLTVLWVPVFRWIVWSYVHAYDL